MKILMVHNDHRFGGGSDVVAAATVEGLRARGHEVERFWRDSKALGEGAGGRLRAFAGGLYASDALRAFRAALDRFRPDVVHAHEVYPLITPWIFRICRARGVAAVMTCHDYRMTCPVYTHLRAGRICTDCLSDGEWACVRGRCQGGLGASVAYALRNRVARGFGLFRPVDVFLTPSRFARRWLVERAGFPANRTLAVGNPVRPPPAPPPPYDPAARRYAAFLGRLSPEKGVDVLVRAAASAGVPLKIAGERRDYAPPPGCGPVEFTGPLAGAALEDFFNGARLLVVPSVWFETFGLVAVEATMRGVPVVGSDIGALTEVIGGCGGALFPPGDAARLADVLAVLWKDDERLCRMSRDGLRRSSRYEAARHFRVVEHAYELAQRKSSGQNA